MDYFDKTYHPPGTAPGTLINSEETSEKLFIHLVDDTNEAYHEKALAGTLKNIGDVFGLHPLALEYIYNRGQRPKVDEFDEQLFLILAIPHIQNSIPEIEQIEALEGKMLDDVAIVIGMVIYFKRKNWV